ncbi:MAG: ribosome small subunit-dependent GTPase A, partial [Chloroflexi bacterium]|nr:ribosome small subunit-dependent GTPase A [Chloroflexota bacterium]
LFSTANPTSMRKRVLAVKDLDTVDPVAVGDRVTYLLAEDGTGVITEVQPRQNKLSRPATDGERQFKKREPREQVIVANVDQIVVVMPAAQPAPSWNLLDRYLATAEASDVPALICFTKADILPADRAATPDKATAWEPPLLPEIALYQQIGYRVILTSAVSGLGIDEVKAALQDRVSVLWGKSGVGKTSLLNVIEPGLGLRVKAVNDHNGEGRHATTHLEMFDLSFGGGVVDTPGQRAFKIWNEIDDYARLLPEMRGYIGRCKFGLDCTHTHEPGCAIRSAVNTGAITARRYESFLGMKEYFGG